MRHRQVVVDNIATPGAPVYRQRYATPLTPRAVRNELVKQSHDHPEGWLEARLTPLDRLLSDDEAEALELYVRCEELLSGNARGGDYSGDRVQSSRTGMTPLPDDCLPMLARHRSAQMRLTLTEKRMMQAFCKQQLRLDDAKSNAELAFDFFLPGKHKASAWTLALKSVAGRLV